MTVNINVETKNIIKVFTLAVLFTLGVFAVIRMYDALVLILTAFFFALALNPAVSFLSKYMPGKRRGPAVAVVMVIALALLSFLTFSIITPIAREASSFADSVPQRIDELQNGENALGEFIQKYKLEDDIEGAIASTKSRFESFASAAVEKVGQFGSGIVTSITGFVITVLMLTNGQALIKKIADKTYRDESLRKRHERLASKMYGIVTGYVNGQVLVALVAAVSALGALFLLKVPYPLPLASIVFVFGLIPLIGNTLAAILAAFFVLYQQIENATLQPLVQGRTTQLPTLVIFTSVILGVALMGPIGGLFAIPLAGCAKIILVDYLDHRSDHKIHPPKNLAAKLKHHAKNMVS